MSITVTAAINDACILYCSQGSICEIYSARVERRRRENRGAEGAEHWGLGLGRGLCPLPRKIFFLHIFTYNFAFCMHSEALLDSFESL